MYWSSWDVTDLRLQQFERFWGGRVDDTAKWTDTKSQSSYQLNIQTWVIVFITFIGI
jgi:hypothetical protein